MPDYPVPLAQELTEEERAERAELCYSIEARAKGALMKGREAVWELAEALYDFDEESGWLALGYESLPEWLAQPEIRLKKSQYYDYVKVHRELVIRRGLDKADLIEMDVSNAARVLPALKRGDVTLETAVDDVKTLAQRDLRDKYGPGDSGQPETEPEGSTNGHVITEDEDPVVVNIADIDWEGPDLDDMTRFAQEASVVLQRIWDEVAPPEKKRMTNDLRDDIQAILERARGLGLIND